MKKFFAIISTVLLCLALVFCAAGCNKDNGKLKVFVPDGAPALSVAGISQTDANGYFTVSVVKAETISAYVSGKMEADVAIMPVNAAVKLLGSGQNYKLLGTVTHGNLYLMKKQSEQDISNAAQLDKLVGKTVGVINLDNVPGLTFKAILQDNDIEFNELKDGASTSADKVNLKSVEASEVNPANTDCQYFVVPEPAATTKKNVTGGKLSFACEGGLQALYGEEGGYPQAVAVAKVSVIEREKKAIEAFMQSFAFSESWIADGETTPAQIVGAIDKMTKGDLAHAFTADNLTKEVIANCKIKFEGNGTGKEKIKSFMQKLNAVSSGLWGTPKDEFFLNYEEIAV